MKSNLKTVAMEYVAQEGIIIEDQNIKDGVDKILNEAERDFDYQVEQLTKKVKNEIDRLSRDFLVDIKRHEDDIVKKILTNLSQS